MNDMDDLDLQIVSACNELIVLKAERTKQKVANCNERARLQRELERTRDSWERRLKSYRSNRSAELAPYQQECQSVLADEGIFVPAFAATRQAQLCLNIHLMAVEESQLHMLNDQNREMLVFMQSAISRLREEQAEMEIKYLNQVMALQMEIENARLLEAEDLNAKYFCKPDDENDLSITTASLSSVSSDSSLADEKESSYNDGRARTLSVS